MSRAAAHAERGVEYSWPYSSRPSAPGVIRQLAWWVKRRERGRDRVSQLLKAFGEFGAAGGASPAERSLGARESLAELLVRLV